MLVTGEHGTARAISIYSDDNDLEQCRRCYTYTVIAAAGMVGYRCAQDVSVHLSKSGNLAVLGPC